MKELRDHIRVIGEAVAAIGTIVVNGSLHPSALAMVSRHGYKIIDTGPSIANLKRLIVGAELLIVRNRIPEDILENASRLRGIVRHGVGLDFIPVRRASELGIPVANVPGGNSQSVAEYVFAAILELSRRLLTADTAVRKGDWWGGRTVAESSIEIHGKCLGVIGVGNVGRRVAEIGSVGFSMTVIGTQRHTENMPSCVQAVDLERLFGISDFIVLCCALTPATLGIVNSHTLSLMKKSAFLINAARGPLIDDVALVSTLRSGGIAGAALDVFSEQPVDTDHPFLGLRNVLLTPHLAALTQDSMARIGQASCEEALRMLQGKRPLNIVNPEIWEQAQLRWQRMSG